MKIQEEAHSRGHRGEVDGDTLLKETLLARGLQPMDKPMLEQVCC